MQKTDRPEPTPSNYPKLIAGQRALIWFTPFSTSHERLIAGAVVRMQSGEVKARCALDLSKAKHLFKDNGTALHAAANLLCEDAARYWRQSPRIKDWQSPLSQSGLAEVSRLTDTDADSALDFALYQQSSLGGLMQDIVMPLSQETLIQQVKGIWEKETRTQKLATMLGRKAQFGPSSTVKVDFWGRHFACYFSTLRDTDAQREQSVLRALGKLTQLKALRRLNEQHLHWQQEGQIGLFDEKPEQHQLVIVCKEQGRAWYALEAMADQDDLRIERFDKAPAAAEYVAEKELTAA